MFKKEDKNVSRKVRHLRVRKKVFGTAERPRLCVFRSTKHIYAQLIDDIGGKTLLAASSLDPDLKSQGVSGGNVDGAKQVGAQIARKALAHGFKEVVFDRGGYIYHGRVAALADAAREGGLEF